jgi:hypothetical protein
LDTAGGSAQDGFVPAYGETLHNPPSAEQTLLCFGCFERCFETMIRNTDTEQSLVSA